MKDLRHSLKHVHVTNLIHLKVDFARVMKRLLEALMVTKIAVRIATTMIVWGISLEYRLDEMSNHVPILWCDMFIDQVITIHVAWLTTMECLCMRLNYRLLDFEAKGQVILNGSWVLMLMDHKRVLLSVFIGSHFFIDRHCAMVLRLHKMMLFYMVTNRPIISCALIRVGVSMR